MSCDSNYLCLQIPSSAINANALTRRAAYHRQLSHSPKLSVSNSTPDSDSSEAILSKPFSASETGSSAAKLAHNAHPALNRPFADNPPSGATLVPENSTTNAETPSLESHRRCTDVLGRVRGRRNFFAKTDAACWLARVFLGGFSTDADVVCEMHGFWSVLLLMLGVNGIVELKEIWCLMEWNGDRMALWII